MESASVRRTGSAREGADPPSSRHLALVFPWLSADRLRLTRPHLFVGRGEAPVALVETRGRVTRLIAVDRAAARAGLAPGCTLAEARTRLPELEAFDHDPHADHDWLDRLAESCGRYTATTVLCPPDALILAITADHGLVDERALAADVEARFARRGIALRHAFGDTAAVAEALARFAGGPAPDERGAVRRLPLAALALDEETAAALADAGLRQVGDVMDWPRATLAGRFGAEVAAAVRRLAGEERTAVPRAVPLGAERHLMVPIVRPGAVLEAVAALVAEAGVALEQRGQGGRRWRARLYREDGEVQAATVEAARPTRDAATVVALLRPRLLRLDAGNGYDLIRLDVPLADALEASQLKLEGGAHRAISEAPRPARRPAPRPCAPEQAELVLPLGIPDNPRPAPVGEEAPRPLHLFEPPQPVDAVGAPTPVGPPARFRWRRALHEVARVEGPERWPCPGPDAGERDYFRVEDRRGRRLWIFRHASSDQRERPRWYVHGVFA